MIAAELLYVKRIISDTLKDFDDLSDPVKRLVLTSSPEHVHRSFRGAAVAALNLTLDEAFGQGQG